MKYNEKENINDYLLRFEKVVRELKSFGANPEELDIICQLLVTLPISFDPLITALDTLDPEKLTMDFVKSRLIDEYNKKQCKNTNSYENSYDQSAMNSYRLVCYNCGKDGHKRYDCPNTTRYRNNDRRANVAKEYEEAEYDGKSSF